MSPARKATPMNPEIQEPTSDLWQQLAAAQAEPIRSDAEKVRILTRLQIGLAQVRAAQEVKNADA